LAAGVAALSPSVRRARADNYPSRPVRVIVGLPPGNSPDIVARLVYAYLSEHLGHPFVVENRPGAATGLATEYVVHTAADGYTLLLVLAGNAVNGWVYKLRYDFVRDVAPVACIGGIPLAMVINSSLPAKTVPEFIAYAKANPGNLFFGSSGNGSLPHILGVLFEMKAGVKLVHVPCKESVFPDLLSGQVQLAFEPVPAVIAYIKSDKLRALGVSTKRRLKVLPDVPALAEFLPDYEATGWLGIGAPAGTPGDVINIVNKAVNAGLNDPKLAARMAALGVVPDPMPPCGVQTIHRRRNRQMG
jgi:tripartite-type tricarboxylate transporter receptor subunit TctC